MNMNLLFGKIKMSSIIILLILLSHSLFSQTEARILTEDNGYKMFSDDYLIFENSQYLYTLTNCGSNCNAGHLKNKKTGKFLHLDDILLTDTINFLVVSIDLETYNLVIHNFAGDYLGMVEISAYNQISGYYVYEKMFFRNGYLFIQWSNHI